MDYVNIFPANTNIFLNYDKKYLVIFRFMDKQFLT
jgi:hypothetical protein